MRKILFSFICISSVFLLSCNESGLNIDEPNTIETHTYANKSMSEAISIAIDAAERLYPTQSRGYAHTASINNVRSVINHLSRAGENDTLLYVVNFDNNEGYAIIPAPNIDKKVLAVTNLKPRKMLGHESQGMLLSSEKDGKVKLAIVGDEHEIGAELG